MGRITLRCANFVGTKFGGGGKRGRAKIHSPQPPFFLPARALDFVPAARSAAIKSFVQKRFERRSVIATSEIKIEPQNGSIFISVYAGKEQLRSKGDEMPKSVDVVPDSSKPKIRPATGFWLSSQAPPYILRWPSFLLHVCESARRFFGSPF